MYIFLVADLENEKKKEKAEKQKKMAEAKIAKEIEAKRKVSAWRHQEKEVTAMVMSYHNFCVNISTNCVRSSA